MLEKINHNRRTFLKWALFGTGAFVLGKVVGPHIPSLSPTPEREINTSSSNSLKNFRITENDRELRLYNRNGEEIVIFEKD